MRRYDVDSLRVILFGFLILYHVGMVFVPWDFHIKNNVTYEGLTLPMLFVNQWRLSLLFVISGIGTWYALSKRSGWQYAGERLKRLLLPLVFGMLVVVPPQVYFERLDKGQFTGSYFDYWPAVSFSGGSYPEGNISWHHLWFLPYLLMFSLFLIPVFLYLRKHPAAWIIRKLKAVCAHPYGFYILIIPLYVWECTLAPYYPSTHALGDDWYNQINYCTLFFYGFLLVSLKDTFWETVTRYRRRYLWGGLIGFPLLISLHLVAKDVPGIFYIQTAVKVFNLWSWCLALFGYCSAYLNRESKLLTYANQAVYPFYILHQTVLVGLTYYIKDEDWGLIVKFPLLVIGTFGISWLIYEFGIRRYKIVRPFFGLK